MNKFLLAPTLLIFLTILSASRTNEKFFDCEIIKRTDLAAMELDEDTIKLILPITLQSPSIIINTLKICATFSEFSLTDWSLDEEE